MSFYIFIILIILQRLCELVVAKRNEKWMKTRGAIEFGQAHYRIIVFIHAMFFIILLLEVKAWQTELSPAWPLLLSVFILTQFLRIWSITSLGKYWNTKIIILSGAPIVEKGPYRFFKHPNYLVVALEFMIIPFMFQAYFTALLFTVLNGVILFVRIQAEEKALCELTEYPISSWIKWRLNPKKTN